MNKKEWTEERIDKLRGLFLKKWESLGEDDLAWGRWLMEHHILVMGLRDVRRAWNMVSREVCIENPTFEGKDEVAEVLEGKYSAASHQGVRKIACEETWYLIPEEFADKALVLGLP